MEMQKQMLLEIGLEEAAIRWWGLLQQITLSMPTTDL